MGQVANNSSGKQVPSILRQMRRLKNGQREERTRERESDRERERGRDDKERNPEQVGGS